MSFSCCCQLYGGIPGDRDEYVQTNCETVFGSHVNVQSCQFSSFSPKLPAFLTEFMNSFEEAGDKEKEKPCADVWKGEMKSLQHHALSEFKCIISFTFLYSR